MRFFLIIILVFSSVSMASPSGRLDPHGDKELKWKDVKDLKVHNECTVCHTEAHGKISLKAEVVTTCLDCHNKAPHSGVAEHMGKTTHLGGHEEKITCLSCHVAHRAQGKPWEQPGHFFSKSNTPVIPSKFNISSKINPMIRRTCTECHRW